MTEKRYACSRITVPATSDSAIGVALAKLAAFPKSAEGVRMPNIYEVGNARRILGVYHGEVVDMVHGDVGELVAFHKPSIIVSRQLRSPRWYERNWQPTDDYVLEIDVEKVSPDLVGRIAAELPKLRRGAA